MKNIFTFSLAAALFLSILTGCNRNLRRDLGSQGSTQPAIESTLAVPPTLIPTVEIAATVATAPATEIPTVQPADTIAPTHGTSKSDAISDQLDSLLNQLDTQLQSVDTIPETP